MFVGAYWVFSHYVFLTKPVKVFVEMKVIDEQGHPIAGANIIQGTKRIGVTDAFGEWSQFLSARAGSTVSLLVRKNIGKEAMGALKELSIPSTLILEQEPRIKTNVHLKKKWRSVH